MVAYSKLPKESSSRNSPEGKLIAVLLPPSIDFGGLLADPRLCCVFQSEYCLIFGRRQELLCVLEKLLCFRMFWK